MAPFAGVQVTALETALYQICVNFAIEVPERISHFGALLNCDTRTRIVVEESVMEGVVCANSPLVRVAVVPHAFPLFLP